MGFLKSIGINIVCNGKSAMLSWVYSVLVFLETKCVGRDGDGIDRDCGDGGLRNGADPSDGYFNPSSGLLLSSSL